MKHASRSRSAILLLWLAVTVTACVYCAIRFAGSSPMQTDLLALLPRTEADPVAEQAVNRLAASMGDRVFFVLESADDKAAKSAARAFGRSLAEDGALRHVVAELPSFDLSQIARFYLPFRFGLLGDEDRALLAKDKFAAHDMLARRLNTPMHMGISTALADDPFGVLQRFLAALPLSNANVTVEDNLLIAHRGSATSVLITASLPASAYEARSQRAVRECVERASARLARDYPSVQLSRAGAVFYADAARRQAEREMHLIGAVSALSIALIMCWVFRSARLVAFGFLSTAIGVVCALAVTLALFGKLHLLTLVFGASLIGEAVDYSIQYFVAHLSMGRDWDPYKGVRSVRAGLTMALGTSILGYAILAAVPFPALAQVGCFAIVGIGVAYASVLWLLPALLPQAAKRTPDRLFARTGRLLACWRAALHGRRAVVAALLIVIACVPGWLRLSGDDDIHLLVRRDASLAAQEQKIRALAGFEGGSQFFLIQGIDEETVLQRAELLTTRLDTFIDDGRVRSVQSVTQFVPSARTQRENRRLFDNHAWSPEVLRTAGLRDDVVRGYEAAHDAASAPLGVAAWLAVPLSAPYRNLWLGQMSTGQFAAIVLPMGARDDALAPLNRLASSLPGTSFVDKAASVSGAFGLYRTQAAWWLAAAFAALLVSFAWRYGIRGACVLAAPVALAVGAALAMFGYVGSPLSLFNLLALMLVLCVGSNYAVFLREGVMRASAAEQAGAVWTGVLLSAATALLSFGTLAFTSMPALRSFGATLSAGIACSACLSPMALNLFAVSRRATDGDAQ